MSKNTIRLNVQEFMAAANEAGFKNDTELAAAMGVSVTQIWRAKLPKTDPRHSSPGTSFIAGVLTVFGGPFERFFFVEKTLQGCNIKRRERLVANE